MKKNISKLLVLVCLLQLSSLNTEFLGDNSELPIPDPIKITNVQ